MGLHTGSERCRAGRPWRARTVDDLDQPRRRRPGPTASWVVGICFMVASLAVATTGLAAAGPPNAAVTADQGAPATSRPASASGTVEANNPSPQKIPRTVRIGRTPAVSSAHTTEPSRPAWPVGYAPVDRPGPALTVPDSALAAALECAQPIASAKRDIVLLIPGTTVDPAQSFGWNYEVAFRALGIPYCTVTLPNHTDGDIQVAAQYVVYSIRQIASASGRQVVLLGWSQGASTLPRWAIRFWPDVRPMVASLVGLAPLNNIGSIVANAACAAHTCVPAAWQQGIGAHFMAALNSGQQTFPGIAYTVIYSRVDDVVTPDPTGALSVLPPGPNVTNVAIQDVCPTDLSEHIGIVSSPAAYAVAINAVEHPGAPARLAQVRPSVPCVPGAMPYVTPSRYLTGTAGVVAPIPQRLLTGDVYSEPPLACYVYATGVCPEAK